MPETLATDEQKDAEELAAGHIRMMIRGPGYAALRDLWAYERELILQLGKKKRKEEGGQAMWAMLDGFDKAVTLADRVVRKLEDDSQNHTEAVQ